MPTADVLAAEFSELARGLHHAGDTSLYNEISGAIDQAAGPVPGEIRTGLAPKMPNRYAATLNAELAAGVQVRRGRADPGVTVWARTRGPRRVRLRRLDQGILEHPLFGNREFWYRQAVRPGWFTQPNQDAAPRVRASLEAALERVKDQIWAGVHGG
jgi:hypothetical protein